VKDFISCLITEVTTPIFSVRRKYKEMGQIQALGHNQKESFIIHMMSSTVQVYSTRCKSGKHILHGKSFDSAYRQFYYVSYFLEVLV
jgi:uncharacterized metal-binding protein